MKRKQKTRIKSSRDTVALYHLVYTHEGFEESAQHLFRLIQNTQKLSPGKKRKLYLDIEGHRNSNGDFDVDMFELQNKFLFEFLSPYLSEIHCPLIHATNTKPQENNIPPLLIIQDRRNEQSF